jgi:hypothetical protein
MGIVVVLVLVDSGRIIVVGIAIVTPPLVVVVVLVEEEPGWLMVVMIVAVQVVDLGIEVKSGLILVIVVIFSCKGPACKPEGDERTQFIAASAAGWACSTPVRPATDPNPLKLN